MAKKLSVEKNGEKSRKVNYQKIGKKSLKLVEKYIKASENLLIFITSTN